ncbi:aspartate/tyrosine/aromatic aminotransferase [Thermanaerovibrio velox DSM 12556]|uniref:Aminotransferase n=1 Tax=Thermanaerovibrio velox DSM 12556 TaxID=926567 RepID=H0US86_9BACT|nr:pyridoxal phosphate-dependent aminotransferase [Thermanaerovibrio velox]EHM10175.1 aspartate/tyrosine/aromatic aminotransferase [Thermanaerovibrio velox DSM 12556]
MKRSLRAQRMAPSATLSLVNKAKALKMEGKKVISFAAGEPDFGSPQAACEAAIEAIKSQQTHYTPVAGIPELREAIKDYYRARMNLDYPVSQITVGSGGKPLLYEAIQVVVDPGDEVLLFTPAWVSYVEQIRLAEGREVLVDTLNTNLIPTREMVEKALSPNTKGMIINTPCNPTGAVWDSKVLEMLAQVARERDLWIIFDEMYERLVYGDAKHVNILQVAPDIKDRTLIVNGASKAYAMTGWRIGYALGPSQWISDINALQGHLNSNASSIAQWAALGAIKDGDEAVEFMRKAFESRRNRMVELLNDMPHVSFHVPEGAFYVFLNISNSPLKDDQEFSSRLLEEKWVAAVPGSAFFAPGYIRLSYSNSMEEIEEGMGRLKEFLSSI